MAAPTREDVLSLLPAAAAAQPTSLVERVDAAHGLLYLRGHGASEGARLELELVRDTTTGAPTPALPSGLAEGTTYEAVPVTDSALRVRPEGGSTITSFGDSGTGRFRVLFDPWADLDAQIERSWRYIISQCTAHGGDVTSGVLTDMAAAHAACAYAAMKAAGDPATAATYEPALRVWEKDYEPYLAKLFAGVPVKGAVDNTPTVSEGSPRFRRLGSSSTDTSWGTSGAGVV